MYSICTPAKHPQTSISSDLRGAPLTDLPRSQSTMASISEYSTAENTIFEEPNTDIIPTNACYGEPMEGIETSRPPSPPTRPDSPANLGPARLQPSYVPLNYGAVEDHHVWRSAFPHDRNLDFLRQLDVKTVLCFVDTEPTEAYAAYVKENDIKRVRVEILPNKDKVNTTIDSLCEALLVVMDAANYPLYIHCNQGKHRTGCVVACLRRMQGVMSQEEIIEEYRTYAGVKARAADIELFTESFQPEMLLRYAREHASFDHRPSLTQLLRTNLMDVRRFVELMASTDGISQKTSERSAQSKTDSGIDFSSAVIDPAVLMKPSDYQDTISGDMEVTVEECDPMSPPPTAGAGQNSFFSSMDAM